ncbi:hypothetical protein [Vibrio metschnikovii]|uniref:hypothetical protein n=1 Tax=Vibrio metschnikovii TaxID=28172 RepID=UPI001C308A2C|nr:hypothetical protein [Vibrio metschnikovii]
MNKENIYGQCLENKTLPKTVIEYCVYIQYYCCCQRLGGAMLLKNKTQLLQVLNVVIDGIALSESKEESIKGGLLIMNMALSNYEGEIDRELRTAIQSIIEMASELESPAFRL